MLFGKKSKKESLKCQSCNSKVNREFSFCPYCGQSFLDMENEIRNFGMLGRNDSIESDQFREQLKTEDSGFADKIIGSLVNSLMKNIDKQMKDLEKQEVSSFPNGIRIKIGIPGDKAEIKPLKNKKATKSITQEQLTRISSLPKASAKTNIKRLSDKIVYELDTPGLQSTQDVLISKTENGYEIKAIGKNKVYVNSLPINLPMQAYSIENGKLSIEFKN